MAIYRIASDLEVSGSIKSVGGIGLISGSIVSASYFTSSIAGGFQGDGSALRNVKATDIEGGYVKSLITGSQTNANLKVELVAGGDGSQGALKVSLVDSPTFTNLTASNIKVTGNLEVQGIITGSITRVETTDLAIKDKTIIIASGSDDAAKTNGAGVQFGESAVGVSFLYNKDGLGSGVGALSSSIGLVVHGDVSSSGTFYGNGSGLTNLTFGNEQTFKNNVIISGSAKNAGSLVLSGAYGQIVDKTDVHVLDATGAGAVYTDDTLGSADYVSGKYLITAKSTVGTKKQAVEFLALNGGEEAVYGELYSANTQARLFTVEQSAKGPKITNVSGEEIKVHIHRLHVIF